MTTAGIQSPAIAAPDRRKRPLRVVHLLHTVAYGGVETIVINWLRSIDRSRVDVHAVCFANPRGTERPFIAAAQRHGIDVRTIPWARSKPVLRSASALGKILQDLGADIVHTHNLYAEIVGLWAARRTGARTITTLYVWADFGWKRNVMQIIEARLIRLFDRVTAQSETARRDTIRLGVRPERVSVLFSGHEAAPLAPPAAERRARRRDWGAEDEHTVLINVARLYPEKAHDGLLRSFHEVHQRCPSARLWILGVGPLEKNVRALCTSLGLDPAVRFLGFVENLASVLPLADIQVHPSHAEGIPLALCAGMAAGLPIVASAVGGLPELLDHGRRGFLVPARDEAAFARGVLSLIEDRATRDCLGRTARAFIEQEYSLPASAELLARTYEAMVSP